MTPIDRIARYLLITLIWLGALGMSLAILISSGTDVSVFQMVILLCALSGAIAGTYILNPTTQALPAESKRETESVGKRKNEQAGFGPLDLLTPDDLEELRAEMKQRLRERMLSDTDGQMASLDELLDEPPARAKRR
ncbi:MAG: hypothetical protein MUF38_12870 [Anaerolineae bacterium]|jgi:hypothetical protein|nr:hypothetical protein [Anaerolineae bacterium]